MEYKNFKLNNGVSASVRNHVLYKLSGISKEVLDKQFEEKHKVSTSVWLQSIDID